MLIAGAIPFCAHRPDDRLAGQAARPRPATPTCSIYRAATSRACSSRCPSPWTGRCRDLAAFHLEPARACTAGGADKFQIVPPQMSCGDPHRLHGDVRRRRHLAPGTKGLIGVRPRFLGRCLTHIRGVVPRVDVVSLRPPQIGGDAMSGTNRREFLQAGGTRRHVFWRCAGGLAQGVSGAFTVDPANTSHARNHARRTRSSSRPSASTTRTSTA